MDVRFVKGQTDDLLLPVDIMDEWKVMVNPTTITFQCDNGLAVIKRLEKGDQPSQQLLNKQRRVVASKPCVIPAGGTQTVWVRPVEVTENDWICPCGPFEGSGLGGFSCTEQEYGFPVHNISD